MTDSLLSICESPSVSLRVLCVSVVNPYRPRLPHHEILRQRPVERHARVQRHVVDAALKALAAVQSRETPRSPASSRGGSCRRRPPAARSSPAPPARPAPKTETPPPPRPECETRSRRARRAAAAAAPRMIGSGSANRSLNTITRLACLSIAASCIRLRPTSVLPGRLQPAPGATGCCRSAAASTSAADSC